MPGEAAAAAAAGLGSALGNCSLVLTCLAVHSFGRPTIGDTCPSRWWLSDPSLLSAQRAGARAAPAYRQSQGVYRDFQNFSQLKVQGIHTDLQLLFFLLVEACGLFWFHLFAQQIFLSVSYGGARVGATTSQR